MRPQALLIMKVTTPHTASPSHACPMTGGRDRDTELADRGDSNPRLGQDRRQAASIPSTAVAAVGAGVTAVTTHSVTTIGAAMPAQDGAPSPAGGRTAGATNSRTPSTPTGPVCSGRAIAMRRMAISTGDRGTVASCTGLRGATARRATRGVAARGVAAVHHTSTEVWGAATQDGKAHDQDGARPSLDRFGLAVAEIFHINPYRRGIITDNLPPHAPCRTTPRHPRHPGLHPDRVTKRRVVGWGRRSGRLGAQAGPTCPTSLSLPGHHCAAQRGP